MAKAAPKGFPLSIRPCFAFGHSMLSFLPFPVWPTVKYKLGEKPTIKITHLRVGHGSNTCPLVPIRNGEANAVAQFHRVYGAFQNLSKDNDQLHIRVLVMPKKDVSRFHDKLTHRWWVQPDEAKWEDGAELKLIHENANSGTWHCDVFFGTPQNRGDPFEILAILTSQNLKRGQVLRDEDVQTLAAVSDRIVLFRER